MITKEEIKQKIKSGLEVTAANFDESTALEWFFSEKTARHLIFINCKCIAAVKGFETAFKTFNNKVEKHKLTISI